METEIRTFPVENGEIQRAQLVRLDRWENVEFFAPEPDPDAFGPLCKLYRDFMVPAFPWVFPQIVLFRLPENVKADFPCTERRMGTVADRQLAAAAALRHGVKVVNGKPRFRDGSIRAFWEALEREHAVQVVCGKLPYTKVIPVGDTLGFLSRQEPNTGMVVNASFFIMDYFDCASPYDRLGTPFGLCVKDGEVLQPPQFGREALLVHRDGTVEVSPVALEKLQLEIGGQALENGMLYSRPRRKVTPRGKGVDLAIIGRRVEAVKRGGGTVIPAGGFVLQLPCDLGISPGASVVYRGMEDIRFGIQVGCSILIDGVGSGGFRSDFCNIRALGTTPFPPSQYPLNYECDRAPRIALGADREGRPMLCWVEGAGKFGHRPGEEGCGASLLEMEKLCRELGMVNAVNLDGGGSAQILIDGARSLRVSDRDRQTLEETERAVPMALRVRRTGLREVDTHLR